MSSCFPIDEEASFTQIAHACHLGEDDTRRILRHAITNRIFKLSESNLVAHTAASKAIAQVPLLREFLDQACSDMWPASTRFVDAMTKWPASEEPSQTAFNIASGAEDPFFVDMAKSPNRSKRFTDAMRFFSMAPGFEIKNIINAYDWAAVGKGVVVDVGGSDGAVAVEIVKAFPSIQVIVQDLPQVIDAARDTWKDKVPSQVNFELHDFFTEQKVIGADVYFLRMILHDWSDKYCLRILKNLIPALKTGTKILINDFCLPLPGTVSQYQERNGRYVMTPRAS